MLKEISVLQTQQICGGRALSYGIKGGLTGGSVGGSLGLGGALMSAANGMRWGAIGGLGGAFLGAAIGIGYYYYMR